MENTANKPIIISPKMKTFISRITNSFYFKLYTLAKMPMGFIAGLRVLEVSPQQAKTTVPFGWLTQNPFKSTYFAVLAMAAELSTAVMALLAIDDAGANVSTLVVGIEGEFTKKATDLTTFTCTEGDKMFAAVQQAISTKEAVEAATLTIGRNEAGEEVARFIVKWSFKVRSSSPS